MVTAILETLVLLWGAQAITGPSVYRWSLQVEPAHCVLERKDSEREYLFSIDTTPGSDSYRMAITGDGIKASASLQAASLSFAPSENLTTAFARIVKLLNNASLILMQGLPPSVLDDLSGTSTVTVEIGRSVKIVVSVAGSAKAIEALRKCNADQLVGWGADPAQFVPGGMMPTALTARDEWISNNELLKFAVQTKRSSINDDFRVLVGNDGSIAECHAVAEITEPSLEKSACAAVVGRRLFHPAKDASGNTVLGAATFKVMMMRHPS